ncbi:MAG: hypothetical protein Q4C70_01575 [Planctomycetia bacterium]|nr:hypothetical protein [Planctomycetia bacterium]
MVSFNRRNFLKSATVSALTGSCYAAFMHENNAYAEETQSVKEAESIPKRNRCPYRDIQWETAYQVHTTTHGHATRQRELQKYLDRGFKFLTLSNYYPSAPYCPAVKMTYNYYKLHHTHPVMRAGKLTQGPFNWNEIVAPWIEQVDEKFRRSFPFKEGGPAFEPLPEGVLEAPNAEHHSFTDAGVHICAPGSAYASGTFDAHNDYKTMSNGKYNFGTGLPWREAFRKMFDGLIFPDGGGLTINHPVWSRLKKDLMMEMLEYDPRVLGIEVFNQSSGSSERYPWSDSYSEEHWDYALSHGCQCFGFFVPDWGYTEGVNVLLVPEMTVHECLRAYRLGNWYGAIKGRGILNFKSIHFKDSGNETDGEKMTGGVLSAETDKTAKFQIISALGVVHETVSEKLSFTVEKEDYARHVFLRIRAFATDDSGEILFSQPFMLG